MSRRRPGDGSQPYSVPVPKGYRVGDWEVREPLASGAFGSVYAARRRTAGAAAPADAELPGPVALKFLPTGTHTPRQLHHLRELAEREVELLSRLQAPRLIRMYEALTVDDPEHPELDGATVLVLEQAEESSTRSSPGPRSRQPAPRCSPRSARACTSCTTPAGCTATSNPPTYC